MIQTKAHFYAERYGELGDFKKVLEDFASLVRFGNGWARWEFQDGSAIVISSEGVWDFGVHRSRLKQAEDAAKRYNETVVVEAMLACDAWHAWVAEGSFYVPWKRWEYEADEDEFMTRATESEFVVRSAEYCLEDVEKMSYEDRREVCKVAALDIEDLEVQVTDGSRLIELLREFRQKIADMGPPPVEKVL